jgi:predicted dehydrogenase
MQPTADSSNRSRRQFLRQSSLGLAAVAAGAELPRVHASSSTGPDEIRIGLIGCGGRGTGAVLDAVGAATKVIYPELGYHTENVAEGATIEKKGIKVTALADLFEDRLMACHQQLQKLGIEIPAKCRFTGFDAYRQLLAMPEVNYVILATPPHFRPQQLQAAIQSGKHVFMEKPAAVDAPGVRAVMEAGRLAREQGLGIAAGTQRRHMPSYRETIGRIQGGEIGDILYAKCYWNGGQIWVVDRQEGWSDLEWQLRNWNYFTWLSGDHIVEQHVHNLDIMNWVLGAHPLRAVSALGGRQSRTGERHGHIFDHFAVEYEYPGEVAMFSQCRQINNCQNIVGEEVCGTKGRSNCQDRIEVRDGGRWRYRQRDPSPYRLEHERLITSIRDGNPLNEAQSLAESTMTAILGREAAYSGQAISWDEALQSETRLGPEQYEWGDYPIPRVAQPGLYRFS